MKPIALETPGGLPATGTRAATWLLLCWGSALGVAGAQSAALGPMGQGQASIAVRSDVKVRMQGLPGTSGAQMEAFSSSVVEVMPDVRACYRELVAKRPTTVGGFDINVKLTEKKRTKLDVKQSGGSDPQLKRCVVKAIASADYTAVRAPAAATVRLDFDNSRARGQASSNASKKQSDAIPVDVDKGGTARASWQSGDRAVAFDVEARGKGAEAVARTAVKGLRDGFSSFLDCRRRAEKGGLSPAGTIDVSLRLARRGGKAQAKVGEVTVASERAARCITRAFRRTRFDAVPAGSKARLRIRFGR